MYLYYKNSESVQQHGNFSFLLTDQSTYTQCFGEKN